MLLHAGIYYSNRKQNSCCSNQHRPTWLRLSNRELIHCTGVAPSFLPWFHRLRRLISDHRHSVLNAPLPIHSNTAYTARTFPQAIEKRTNPVLRPSAAPLRSCTLQAARSPVPALLIHYYRPSPLFCLFDLFLPNSLPDSTL